MTDGTSLGDFLGHYRSISNKLKRRFLRKPNLTEASDQFASLAVQCERDELPQYAGQCWLAAARCQGSLGHTANEAWDLTRAGRRFLEAECHQATLGCPGPASVDHLQAALSCYSHAANRWQHHYTSTHPLVSDTTATSNSIHSPLAAGLALELGQTLHSDLGLVAEAAVQFRTAAERQIASPLDRLDTLGHLASCYIEQGNYDGALNIFNEMVAISELAPKPISGIYCDILHRCELTRVLILLILQPAAQRLPADLAELLDKYAWAEQSAKPPSYLSEDEFLFLQSLVLACQTRDLSALYSLEQELWSYLTAEQRDLLRILVTTVQTASK